MFYRSDGKIFCLRDQREQDRRQCEKCPENLEYDEDMTGIFERCGPRKEMVLAMIKLNQKFESKGKKQKMERSIQKNAEIPNTS